MRTSNKILLVTFVAAIVILTCLNIALYAKYKKGEITFIDRSAEYDRYQLPSLKYVELKGLGNIHIYPADSFRLDLGKGRAAAFKYQVNGNTLIITGDTVLNGPRMNVDRRVKQKQGNPAFGNTKMEYTPVDLYLPFIEKISAESCELTLHGSNDSTSAKSFAFDLANTHLSIGSNVNRNGGYVYWNNDSAVAYWKQVAIKARSSHVDCEKNGNIRSLELDLAKSSLKDNNFTIDSLSLVMDPASSIELHGQNATKLNTFSKQ